MSETKKNAEEQSNADGDTETQFVPEEVSDEEEEVAEANADHEMYDSSDDERAEDDEIIMYGQGRETTEHRFEFPYPGPSIIEVIFDEDQQQYVAAP